MGAYGRRSRSGRSPAQEFAIMGFGSIWHWIIVLIVVLVLFGRRSYLPAALGLPYVRGAR